MKKLLTAVTLLFVQLNSFGQQDFGEKINGGFSEITANRNLKGVTDKYSFAPSGQAGLFYNCNLGKKSLLSVELLFVQIESKERIEEPTTNGYGSPTGENVITNLDYHIFYFSIPIYYGFKINKFTFNLGVQTSIALSSRGHQKTQFPNNGSTDSWEHQSKLNIKAYDFGPRAGIIFNLSKRFAVEATYYYGVNNILKEDAPAGWNWKVQQMTLGLRYKFLMRMKKQKSLENKK